MRAGNPPGLPAIRYRAGTQPEFLARMLAALSRQAVPDGTRPLSALSARTPDDPMIGLLDAWATVGDVLTFYQERIANEGFLRTATERRSVLELARAIGYELRPGVAASTFLAFTVDDAPGAPGSATVPAGSKIQSIPAKGGLPQTFETSTAIECRAAWNALKPRLRQPQPVDLEASTIFVEGTVSDVKVGDLVLIVTEVDGTAVTAQKQVTAVTVEAALTRTRVDLEGAVRDVPPYVFKSGIHQQATLAYASFDSANVQSYVLENQWAEDDLTAFIGIQGWDSLAIEQTVYAAKPAPPAYIAPAADDPLPPVQVGVYAFKVRVGAFGNTAPRWASLPKDQRVELDDNDNNVAPYPSSWDAGGGPSIRTDSAGNTFDDPDFYLERTVAEITKGTFVVLEDSDTIGSYRVAGTLDASLADFAISARVTGLTVQDPAGGGPTGLDDYKMRSTTIHGGSRPLALAQLPIEATFGKGTPEALQLTLDTMVLGLTKGRSVVITGERADLPGVIASEGAELKDIVHGDALTTLFFATELTNTYVRSSATISANVVRATHGETVNEVLGGGNASRPNQRFSLRRPPLTYIAGGGPSGAASTLSIRVNDILWPESPSLYATGPHDETYIVRIDDDHVPTVIFGDGTRGTRLPSGAENVTATYRTGIGLAGQVPADSLTLLQTRPPGVRGVTNPVAASGAAEPEALADARSNAPLTVLAMGRIVSLRDYEDFVAGYAGIGKAQAALLVRGETAFVHVTIAAADGTVVSPSSELFLSLQSEVAHASDPIRACLIETFRPIYFHLNATIRIDPRYRSDAVVAAAKDAVRHAFAFDRRAFGQPVTAAEVVTVIQGVAGVIAVDLDDLFRVDNATDPPPPTLATVIASERAGLTASSTLAAQLLLVNPGAVDIRDAGAT